MSFVLPGNSRQLRFTGEQKAFKDENSSGGPGAGLALGKPRVRKPTTPPPAPPQPSARRNTSMTPASPGTSNAPQNPGSISRPGSYNASIRAKHVDPNDRSWDSSDDDQQSTMAFDRDGNDVMPGGPPSLRPTLNPPPPRAVSVAPIPHFRPANAAVQTVIVPNQTGSTELRNGSKGAPLALWIFAAILAGILSYYVTPTVMSHFEAPPPPPAKVGG